MSKEEQTKWKCDICGNATTTERSKKPKGWAAFDIENRYCDRMWDSKCICVLCMKAARKELAKAGEEKQC